MMVEAANDSYTSVVAYASKVIELDPKNALAYEYRAWAYGNLGDTEAALADYAKAVELAPDLWDIYVDRYQLYESMGLYEEAIADLETLLSMAQDVNQISAIEGEIARLQAIPEAVNGFRTYADAGLGITLTYPYDWRLKLDTDGGGLTVYAPERSDYPPRVSLYGEEGGDNTLDEAADQLLAGIERNLDDLRVISREATKVDGRPGIRLSMEGTLSDGTKIRGVALVAIAGDRLYSAGGWAAQDTYDQDAPVLEAILNSIRLAP
jgi:tetratricopeptide (TPR) repeat protein